MTTRQVMTAEQRGARECFEQDTADHVMQIRHDDGLYRHISFGRPGSSHYRYDLVTWPGHLAISGDIGDYTFRRLADMFEFFHGPDINPTYWAEKLVAPRGTESVMEVTSDRAAAAARTWLRETLDSSGMPLSTARDLVAAFRAEVIGRLNDGEHHRDVMEEFCFQGPTRPYWMDDLSDRDMSAFKFRFLYCCHAIRAGIEQYRAANEAQS